MFKELNFLIPLSRELEILHYLYSNFVTWEPIDRRFFRKRFKALEQNIEIQCHKSYFLDPFDTNSCVVGVNLDSEDLNRIVLASNNTLKVFEASKIDAQFLKLNTIMPQMIGRIHDSILEEYKQNQVNRVLFEHLGIWAVTAKKKVFFAKTTVKMLMTNQMIKLMAYVKAVCYKRYMIVNRYGEVDCFGEYFHQITGINYDTTFTGTIISIFLFLPSLIPFFLAFLYDKPDFNINKFDPSWLKNSFFIVYKNQRDLLISFSKILAKAKSSKSEYCKAIYDFISAIEYTQIKQVFQVKIQLQEFHFQRQVNNFGFIEIAMSEIYEVTDQFQFINFTQITIFLEKLNFTPDLIFSLDTYDQRIQETKNEDLQKIKVHRSLINFSSATTIEKTITKKHALSDDRHSEVIDTMSHEFAETQLKYLPSRGERSRMGSRFSSAKKNEDSNDKNDQDSGNMKSAMTHNSDVFDSMRERACEVLKHQKLKDLLIPSPDRALATKWFDLRLKFLEKQSMKTQERRILNIGKVIRMSASRV